MVVSTRLTAKDLTTNLDEVLARVRDGERFEIEQDGEVIAAIVPESDKPGITWGEFVATYFDRPRPDDRFVEDMEAIIAEREQDLLPGPPAWPD